MILYDIINKKIIELENISLDIKRDILEEIYRPLTNLELKNNDKNLNYENYLNKFRINMSTSFDHLPMYDINNHKIYFIFKKKVYSYIKNFKFRPIDNALIRMINENNLDKNIINIINYFNFEILENLLLKFVYYSQEVGGDISYFINPAFVSFLDINPYLKKSAIINTALNLGFIKQQDLENYSSREKIKELYQLVKYVFFNKDELLSHVNHISQEGAIRSLKWYTFYGAFFLNKYLRSNNYNYYDETIIKQINTINKLIRSSPKLNTEKIIFRYIKSDDFIKEQIKNLERGAIYKSDSFFSCTRKPHVDAVNEDFGFILLKINLPKDINGVCLSIESDSVFPEEKEVILPPGTKLKLLNLNDEVEFFTFNPTTQKNIKKKYEFEFIGIDDFKIPEHPKIKIPEIDFLNEDISGEDLNEKVAFFHEKFSRLARKIIVLLPNGKKKELYCNFYSSIDSYSKFFYYKIIDGMYFYGFNDDNEIDIFIELGESLIVNYPSKLISIESDKNTRLIASLIAYSFRIGNINLYPDYIRVTDIVSSKNKIFTSRIYINCILYKICQNRKVEEFDFIRLNKIKDFLNNKITEKETDELNWNLQKYLPNKSRAELLIDILKINPIDVKYFLEFIPKKIKNLYYNISPYNELLDKALIYTSPSVIDNSTYTFKRTKKTPEFNIIELNNFRTLVN